MRTNATSIVWAALVVLLGIGTGCELIASADRDKIPAEGTGGTAPTTTSTSSSASASTGSGATGGDGGMAGAGGATGGGGEGGVGGGMGGAMGCMMPSDCGQTTDCATPTCDNMLCGIDFTAANMPIAMQAPMDCQVVVCDGAGATQPANDDADIEDDGMECTIDACQSGSPTHFPEAITTPCSQGGGKVCDGAGACVECVAPNDCASLVCDMNVCQTPICSDMIKNGSETDVDCGGASCPTCATGDDCLVNGDCATGSCVMNICQLATCADGVLNGNETDQDCGGPDCGDCADGDDCLVATDCASGVCTGDVCQVPTCNDGVKNGFESDVDCGGAACPDCADGDLCGAGSDCVSGVCSGSPATCQAATCSDGVQNASETDVDCGGPTCSDCANGDSCNVPGDCLSGVCTGGICQAPTCMDMVQNGSETDIDCGGPGCADCGNGKSCLVAGDCVSMVCSGNPLVCQAPTCMDMVKNGTESDVDCGGSCPGCMAGQDCVAHADCAGGACNMTTNDCSLTCNDMQAPGATCASYCSCMMSTCAGKFPSLAACINACSTFAMPQICCRAYHCTAAMSDAATHCPHAAGEALCP